MSAFLTAATALAADDNLGQALTWISRHGGPSRTIRGIIGTDEAGYGVLDAPRQTGASVTATIALDVLSARPERGDLIATASLGYRVETVTVDTEAASYTLTLRRS